jgi:hypothetical protein
LLMPVLPIFRSDVLKLMREVTPKCIFTGFDAIFTGISILC